MKNIECNESTAHVLLTCRYFNGGHYLNVLVAGGREREACASAEELQRDLRDRRIALSDVPEKGGRCLVTIKDFYLGMLGIIHGTRAPFMEELIMKLEEARAEAHLVVTFQGAFCKIRVGGILLGDSGSV